MKSADLAILYDDPELVILAKPSALLTIPDRHDPTLPSLKHEGEKQVGTRLWTVHRLDRETSGAVVFAKDEDTHRHLSILFEKHAITKLYAGLVNGHPNPEAGRIDAPIAPHPTIPGKMHIARGGKESLTDYKLVESWPLHSLMQFQIHTGRTHQIRVHLKHIGLSLVSDKLYGDGKPFLLSTIKKKFRLSDNQEEERPLLSRLALHAYHLSFQKADGTIVTAEAPMPKDMAATITQLRKWTGR